MKKGIILLLSICLIILLLGCSSILKVPEEELKSKALDAINSKYRNAFIIEFIDANYDESKNTYDMFFRIESHSEYGFSIVKKIIRAQWGCLKTPNKSLAEGAAPFL